MKGSAMVEMNGREIGIGYPTYFVADIAANHDGSLDRARELIRLAAMAGADAAKFQHFQARTIVSDAGFKALGKQHSHQAAWRKSVFEVYRDASVDLDWTPYLKAACDEAGIHFFTSPYSLELVDHVDPFVPGYKIGSGDITWLELIEYVASKGKPVMIATGAADIGEVQRAVSAALSVNPRLVLMQCNTNYTGDTENFKYIHLNVLTTYRAMYPHVVLGLSDHTPGHSTVLGAVALGARVIEKHFTDNIDRVGPDHKFSMDPDSWKAMVNNVRELEAALGFGRKRVEMNENETVVLQRRAIRMAVDMRAGTTLERHHVSLLRPCPTDALPPSELSHVLGLRMRRNKNEGDYLKWTDLE